MFKAAATRQNFRKVYKARMSEQVPEVRTHIQIRNLPRSALPTDVRRVTIREKLTGVTDVMLDYHRFKPTGRAYLEISHPDFTRPNVVALERTTVSGMLITAYPSPAPNVHPTPRTRGVQGRIDAAERGAIKGNGPHGGFPSFGKCVVLWGFPGKSNADMVRGFLKGFELVGGQGNPDILQVALPDTTFSLYSRYIVRTTSIAEAYRIVRKSHMTYYKPDSWGERYQIRARVVY
ncbi:hypothetical protein BJ138DRAFT_1123028 [Hygrophoropsis aurantiaca]|uniref:Uncharacterized protein n=1 Tax=Hygrophoropsis aurantiaca TaxID=72124 RepID=A0ACB8AN36_9AGAM|nr:hypothetical protein BJ138DRAFT_1123028 [Hygrophoropsis aurantiaca]